MKTIAVIVVCTIILSLQLYRTETKVNKVQAETVYISSQIDTLFDDVQIEIIE